MAEIVICHRRDDAPAYVGRLYDLLAAHFGAERVSWDIAEVAPGTDFADSIERALGSSQVLIVIIGNDWLAADGKGRRRLDDPDDIVRRQGLSLAPRHAGTGLPRRAGTVYKCIRWRAGSRHRSNSRTCISAMS